MKRARFFRMGIIITLALSLSDQNTLFAQFITIDTSFYSPSLKEMRNVTVFLPDDYYKEAETQYSTIYYLHGWGGNEESLNSSQARLNELLESGTIRPVIIICADHSAYPFGSGVYVNSPLTGDFEDYAAFDVVDWVESSFRAIPEKNARALFGQSLGAYGAFWLGIQHKDRFRVISAHAGHINNDVWMPLVRLMVILENGQPPYFYDFFAFNSEDPEAIPDFFTKCMFLAASGYSPEENSPQTYINPRIVEYPFNEWANLIDSVYSKWITYDIAHTISNLTPVDSVSILFGCGTNDETMAYLPNLALRDTLANNNLSFEFLGHKAGHSMPDIFFNRSMIFLDSLLMHPSIINAADASGEKFNLEAFPNPVKDLTTIRLLPGESDIKVSVLNSDGSELTPATFSEEINGQELTLDFSGCRNGVYLVHFKSSKRTGRLKIIVAA